MTIGAAGFAAGLFLDTGSLALAPATFGASSVGAVPGTIAAISGAVMMTQGASNGFVGEKVQQEAAKTIPHKNSLDYVGETHVYRVKGPDGTFKIGESAQGVRVSDGASVRAEQQARRLTRETGDRFETDIRKTFPDKASARDYETRLIERFRRMYGDDTLPGNKTNR